MAGPLRPGDRVKFREGTFGHAKGARAGTVVSPAEPAGSYVRRAAARLGLTEEAVWAQALGAAAGGIRDLAARLRLRVTVALDPCPMTAVPGLEVQAEAEDLEQLGAAPAGGPARN